MDELRTYGEEKAGRTNSLERRPLYGRLGWGHSRYNKAYDTAIGAGHILIGEQNLAQLHI